MSFQISFKNDRPHNPYSEAQYLLSSLSPWSATNLKAALVQAAHKVGKLRWTHVEVLLELLEGL